MKVMWLVVDEALVKSFADIYQFYYVGGFLRF